MLFKLDKNMELFSLVDQNWKQVDISPCFPKTLPQKYLSVRNSDGKEIKLIEDLEDLDLVNRKTLEDFLRFKMFNFEITGIYKVEEEFGVRHFEVKTGQGDRLFQTELDAWPTVTPNNQVQIKDIYGDNYTIKNLEFGQALLQPLIE